MVMLVERIVKRILGNVVLFPFLEQPLNFSPALKPAYSKHSVELYSQEQFPRYLHLKMRMDTILLIRKIWKLVISLLNTIQ